MLDVGVAAFASVSVSLLNKLITKEKVNKRGERLDYIFTKKVGN